MKQNHETIVEIPDGINCKLEGHKLYCSKGNTELIKEILSHTMIISIKGKEIVLLSKKSSKKGLAKVNAIAAHIRNLFAGLNERFIYEMEICNVHFPMTVKVDKDSFIITNFLGEKVPRSAKILSGVEVKVNGTKVTISSADIEKAGQTAANIEKASTVTKKDRRIFQDGIFITKKPGADK
jgi:large subunit ribosomal protein L6